MKYTYDVLDYAVCACVWMWCDAMCVCVCLLSMPGWLRACVCVCGWARMRLFTHESHTKTRLSRHCLLLILLSHTRVCLLPTHSTTTHARTHTFSIFCAIRPVDDRETLWQTNEGDGQQMKKKTTKNGKTDIRSIKSTAHLFHLS